MEGKGKYINGNNGREQENNSWTDTDILFTPEDSALFKKISDYMRICLDIEDVKSDPLFKETNNVVRDMIAGFNQKSSMHKANAKFIRESLKWENEEEKLEDEINVIKDESRKNDLGKITAEWVREWDEKRQKSVSPDAKSKERKEFIINSLEEAESDHELNLDTGNTKFLKKTILIRFALPAVAAVIGAFFLIKLLLPSYDPDKLYTKYYEPMNALFTVTRGANASETESYTSAIESYNNNNYQAAANSFSDAILQDTLNISSRFFMSLTQMALENYDQAENLLEDVINRQGEYVKEARWYLGLAYIKTGNSEKAYECFEIIAQSHGFYSDRARKILRRLR